MLLYVTMHTKINHFHGTGCKNQSSYPLWSSVLGSLAKKGGAGNSEGLLFVLQPGGKFPPKHWDVFKYTSNITHIKYTTDYHWWHLLPQVATILNLSFFIPHILKSQNGNYIFIDMWKMSKLCQTFCNVWLLSNLTSLTLRLLLGFTIILFAPQRLLEKRIG